MGTNFRLCGAGIVVFFRSIKDDSVPAILKIELASNEQCRKQPAILKIFHGLVGWGIGELCVVEARFRGEALSELI